MDTPFLYGRIAENENFTNRKSETEFLEKNFRGLINTIIISPRRWGKTSLVHKVAKLVSKENKDIIVCQVDIFNCRTEEEFYTVFANSLLKSTTTIWEEFVSGVKKYLGRLAPVVSISDATQTYELSFGIDFKDSRLSYDEILDLPQVIANDTKKKIVVCIDEFQNVANFGDSLAFQKKLRAHWQRHSHVAYCLFGSKRHMLMDVFANVSMPFYKFGDLMFLQKIETEEWIPFIRQKFQMANKVIERDEVQLLVELVDNHPYYVQQLAQQVWLRTEKLVVPSIVKEAYNGLIDQLSLLFLNSMETFSNAQLGFLKALIAGEKQLSSKQTLQAYRTSGNVVRIKQALMEREVIDLQGNKITFQDPLFEAWLKRDWFK